MDIDEISVHKLSCIELISPNCVNHCRLLAHQQVQRITILCSTFHRCLYRLQLSSYYKPRHCMSLTSQTSYHKGQETLPCVPWVNVWHVSKDKVNDVRVRTLCGKTQHILISSFVLQVSGTDLFLSSLKSSPLEPCHSQQHSLAAFYLLHLRSQLKIQEKRSLKSYNLNRNLKRKAH